MRIHCTKDEFNLMAVNCHDGDCSLCVLAGICKQKLGQEDTSNFLPFIVDVNCYNPYPQTGIETNVCKD